LSEDGWLRGRKAIAAYLDTDPTQLSRFFRNRGCFPIIFDGRMMTAKKEDIDEWIRKRSKRMCPYDISPCDK
jgi:hypothetical protein